MSLFFFFKFQSYPEQLCSIYRLVGGLCFSAFTKIRAAVILLLQPFFFDEFYWGFLSPIYPDSFKHKHIKYTASTNSTLTILSLTPSLCK